jgi:hypothetical protein
MISDKEPVICNECFATFTDPSALTRHRQSTHDAPTRAQLRARRRANEEDAVVGLLGQPYLEAETAQSASSSEL